ncbi:MAG: hypothetical protein J2P48_18995 [Alphaproteobacteria bacterium]|nr:hypothetical protein [Alphaproteobacteria bacterium]
MEIPSAQQVDPVLVPGLEGFLPRISRIADVPGELDVFADPFIVVWQCIARRNERCF